MNEKCAGIIWVFSKGILRIIENNKDYANVEKNQEAGEVLNE